MPCLVENTLETKAELTQTEGTRNLGQEQINIKILTGTTELTE
jgi:hypothetical protein